jgi:hypothetical protein
MTPSVHIDVTNGSVNLGSQHTIRRGSSQADLETMLGEFKAGDLDYGNGRSWLYLHDLTFGEMPCQLALLFREKRLAEIHFAVALPDAPIESGWPTLEAINNEIAFVRKALHVQLKRRFRNKAERFGWGVAWSSYDERGFRATAGIRYG